MKSDFFVRNGLVGPGDLVFDIGAAIGRFTEQFLALGTEVICIEPLPINAERLREKYGDRVTVVECAVSDKAGNATLYTIGQAAINTATLRPDTISKQFWLNSDRYNREIIVETTTIDALKHRFGLPAFCKIDVEGGEVEVFKGMSVRIPALCFEFGCGYLEEMEESVVLLSEHGYEFNYVLGHMGEFRLPSWTPAESFGIIEPAKNEQGKFLWGNVFARLNNIRWWPG